MADLGDMIVTFSADTSALISGIGQAESALSGIGATAEESEGGFGSFGDTISSVGSGIMDFAQNAASTIFSLQMLGQTAIGLASAFLQPAETAETTTLSFTTLLGSTKAANQEMQNLNTYAAGTPMQTQWVDGAAEKILAFGGKVSDVKPEINAIGDSLSGLGKLSDASLNSIVDIFGKISASGKLTGGDMMQLSNWGIPAWKALSESMHLPIPELQSMVSKGLIPASQALPALEAGMEKTFGGGMQKQANTFAGLVSTLQSNWQIWLASIGMPVLKELEPLLAQVGTDLSSPAFQNFATIAGKDIGDALIIVFTGIGDIVSAGQGLTSFFQHNQVAMDAFKAIVIGAGIAVMLFAITQIPAIVVAFGAWAVAAGAAALATLVAAAPFILIGAIIAVVVFGIILAIQHWGAISKWFGDLWHTISSDVGAGFSWLGTQAHNFVGDIGDAFSGLGTLVSGIWNGIGADIKNAINGVIGLIDGFIGGIDSIGIHVGSVNIQPNIPEIPYLASGTNNFAGGWAVVGENGPELVNLPGGSSVIPNSGSYPIKPSASAVANSVNFSGSSGSSGGASHTTVVELDGTQLAKIVQKHTDQLVRLKLGPKGRVA